MAELNLRNVSDVQTWKSLLTHVTTELTLLLELADFISKQFGTTYFTQHIPKMRCK